MKSDFSQVFNTLLDTSAGLGVGLVDANGLLVHSAGAHGGLNGAEVGAHLVALRRYSVAAFERAFDDEISEHVVVGRRHSFYLLLFEELPYLIYVVTGKSVPGSRARLALQQARESLTPLLGGKGLLFADRKRLEQPRQFRNPWLF